MKIIGMTMSLLCLFTSLAIGAETLKPVAVCRDGKTYSNATGEHRGACSGHGGVASWANGQPVRSKGGKGSYKYPLARSPGATGDSWKRQPEPRRPP